MKAHVTTLFVLLIAGKSASKYFLTLEKLNLIFWWLNAAKSIHI